jgi:hypothetical protein
MRTWQNIPPVGDLAAPPSPSSSSKRLTQDHDRRRATPTTAAQIGERTLVTKHLPVVRRDISYLQSHRPQGYQRPQHESGGASPRSFPLSQGRLSGGPSVVKRPVPSRPRLSVLSRPAQQQLEDDGHDVARDHRDLEVLDRVQHPCKLGFEGRRIICGRTAAAAAAAAAAPRKVVEAVPGQEPAPVQDEERVGEEEARLRFQTSISNVNEKGQVRSYACQGYLFGTPQRTRFSFSLDIDPLGFRSSRPWEAAKHTKKQAHLEEIPQREAHRFVRACFGIPFRRKARQGNSTQQPKGAAKGRQVIGRQAGRQRD